MLKYHFERIINYTTPEGMKRQAELTKRHLEEMRKCMGGKNLFQGADEAGWGSAKEDLTWVKKRPGPG
jgi:hypothetical protein